MTTKEQERKALEKIIKIVEELGEGSYLSMAFDGCFDIARDNIEYDFGDSYKARAEAYQESCHSLQAKIDSIDKTIESYEQDNKELQELILEHRKEINYLKDCMSELEKRNKELCENEERIKELETENMKLKAKLYDLMINE